ncbi:hypothetical protein [Streptomyces sp. NPDC090798]|uniref:hypothetical protein n=1 Tax=Streptomyces sp. NPDC090798 TaxID=3365968 RepID=UPI003827E002
MTPQRTRTADGDDPQLPDDDEDIKVGDEVKPGTKKRAAALRPAARSWAFRPASGAAPPDLPAS